MTRWYPLLATDDDFLRTAPFRFVHSVDVPAPAEDVWRLVTADDALVSWSRMITSAEWTSPRPFGVGTTRTVIIGPGAAGLKERFYRWDEGLRMTFSAEAASRPGFRRFSEDIVLESAPAGTWVTWTFAVEAEPRSAPLLRTARPVVDRVTRGWARGLVRRAQRELREGAR